MVPILSDEDLSRLVSMGEAIEVIEAAMARKASGSFITPPRHYFATERGALSFTIGGHSGEGVVGFRVYGMFAGASENDQLVVVYDAGTGRLRGIVQGARLGALRTGAIGGVALKYAARADASVLAMIGSGRQARTQLEAAAVVRELTDVRVYSRSAEKREPFATEMASILSLPVRPVASPAEAIAGADIVIAATDSRNPVFEASLIEPAQHVTTVRLGAGTHELDAAVADRAGAIFTDSIEQVRSYPGGFFLADRIDTISELAEHVARGAPVRSAPGEITLYCSAGLSGTEVVVADLALRKAGVA